MKLSIFINRILRNTFPVKLYYHFSLVNWTAATESAASYEHAHCAWYGLLMMYLTGTGRAGPYLYGSNAVSCGSVGGG